MNFFYGYFAGFLVPSGEDWANIFRNPCALSRAIFCATAVCMTIMLLTLVWVSHLKAFADPLLGLYFVNLLFGGLAYFSHVGSQALEAALKF